MLRAPYGGRAAPLRGSPECVDTAWLEYVRSKGNVADEPSRVDLSGKAWDCDIGVHSEPVECKLPQQSRWKESAAEWTLRPPQ